MRANRPQGCGRSDAGAPMRALLHFRKQNRQCDFRGVHATGVVAAEGNDQGFMLRFVFRVHISGKGLTTCQARRTLGHRRARRIESRQRQYVEFTERVTYCAPAEWPVRTIPFRFGKTAFRDSWRKIWSIKSYDVSLLLLVATPPERQLSPEQLQLISSAATVSRQPRLSFDAKRGAIMIVSSNALARKPAASALRK